MKSLQGWIGSYAILLGFPRFASTAGSCPIGAAKSATDWQKREETSSYRIFRTVSFFAKIR